MSEQDFADHIGVLARQGRTSASSAAATPDAHPIGSLGIGVGGSPSRVEALDVSEGIREAFRARQLRSGEREIDVSDLFPDRSRT